MKITKAKLKNRSLDIEYDETTTFINSEGEAIESTREHAVKCSDICHDSLVYAFDRLRPHAALIADLREAIKVENAIANGTLIGDFDVEELKNLIITGIVITGSDDDGSRGAMIILQKQTGSRVINITTPIVKFEDPDYAYGIEFEQAIHDVVTEVIEYMNGKVAVKQLEMNFDEGFDDDSAHVKEPKEPKKRGRKPKIEGFTAERAEDGTVILHQEVA